MTKRFSYVAIPLVLMALFYMFRAQSSDAAISELEQLQENLFAQRSSMSEAEISNARASMMQRIGQLSESQRRAFFTSRREWMIGQVSQRLDEFFALPPAQQSQRLDEHVKMIAELGGGGMRFGPPGGQSKGLRRGPQDGKNASPEERESRQKRRLDFTNPKVRTQFTEYRRQLNERLEEKGASTSRRTRWISTPTTWPKLATTLA